MQKERFCAKLREFHQLVIDAKSAHNALKTLDPEFGGLFLGRHETMILALLEELMEDTGKDSMISYWVYELDWGKKAKDYKVTCHGKNYTLQTPEQLWDFIAHYSEGKTCS